MKSGPLANISEIKLKKNTVKGYFSNWNIKTNQIKSRCLIFQGIPSWHHKSELCEWFAGEWLIWFNLDRPIRYVSRCQCQPSTQRLLMRDLMRFAPKDKAKQPSRMSQQFELQKGSILRLTKLELAVIQCHYTGKTRSRHSWKYHSTLFSLNPPHCPENTGMHKDLNVLYLTLSLTWWIFLSAEPAVHHWI